MLIKQLSRFILSLGFIMAIVSLQAEEKSEPLFDGAPKDSEGRFTNTNGDLSHGSAAVRVPFFFRRHSAIRSASMTRSALGLLFMLQPTTCRENRSSTIVRYNQPSWVRT